MWLARLCVSIWCSWVETNAKHRLRYGISVPSHPLDANLGVDCSRWVHPHPSRYPPYLGFGLPPFDSHPCPHWCTENAAPHNQDPLPTPQIPTSLGAQADRVDT